MSTRTLRLNRRHREILREYARQSLVCAAEVAAENDAFFAYQQTLNAFCRWHMTDAEQATLQKFGLLHAVDYIRFHLTPPGSTSTPLVANLWFAPRDPHLETFNDSKYRPVRAEGRVSRMMPIGTTSTNIDVNNLPVSLARDIVAHYGAYRTAALAHDAARERVLDAADDAIARALTFEALIKVWPAAEHCRASLMGKLLPTIVDRQDATAQILAGAVFTPMQTQAPSAPTDG